MASRHLKAYLGVTAVWLAYTAVTFLTPTTSNNQLNLSPIALALIRLTIAIPYLLAWLAGIYGALTLFSTSKTMPEKEDGIAFDRIARGILILVLGLIAASVISAFRSYQQAAGADISTLVVVINYINVFMPLVGFAHIYSGTSGLRNGSSTAMPPAWTAVATLAMILFTVLYVWLIFTNPTRQMSDDPTLHATYYLPDAAIFLTIVIPFLATFVLACIAIMRLMKYYRGVTGFLYKQASLNFIYGLVGAIGGSLLLQALLSLGSSRLLGLGLGPLLLIIYAFIFVQTMGYVFVALGAKKLAAIERIMTKYASEEKAK